MKKLYEETHIQDIATAIREKNGTTDTYKPSEMGEAIKNIVTGGSGGSGGLTLLYTAEITEPVNQIRIALPETWRNEYDFICVEPDNVIPSTTEWLCLVLGGTFAGYIGSTGSIGKNEWNKKDIIMIMKKVEDVWYWGGLSLESSVIKLSTYILFKTYYADKNTFNSGTIRLYGGKW